MSGDRETLKVYDAKAGDYAKFVENVQDTPQLTAFLAELPEGACVLDLGCGPGNSAARFAASGHKVDATDASAEMVALAAEKPGVTAWQATFDEIEGEDLYDGIWANFSLLHAERADLPRHLADLRRALKPGGVFHIGMKTGDGAERDGIGRYYTYYSALELSDLLAAAEMTPFLRHDGEEVGLAGTLDPWITLLCRG